MARVHGTWFLTLIQGLHFIFWDGFFFFFFLRCASFFRSPDGTSANCRLQQKQVVFVYLYVKVFVSLKTVDLLLRQQSLLFIFWYQLNHVIYQKCKSQCVQIFICLLENTAIWFCRPVVIWHKYQDTEWIWMSPRLIVNVY